MKNRVLVTLLTLLAPLSFAAGQSTENGTIELRGFGRSKTLTMAELAVLPHRTVTASSHNVTGTFSGVALIYLLHLIGAPPSDSLRGRELADYVVIDARDGYRAVYALAELDSGFTDRIVVLADHMDGKPIDAKDGPLHLITPGEKRPARWVRQVTRITLMRATP